MNDIKVGFAFCASHCCMEAAIEAFKRAREEFGEVVAVMSERAARTDTRFGSARNTLAVIHMTRAG